MTSPTPATSRRHARLAVAGALLGSLSVAGTPASLAAAAEGPERVAGQDRWATAVAVADRAHPVGDGTGGLVVVATGQDWPDALSAGAAAAALDAPLLLTGRDALPEATRAAVDSRGPDEVLVVGGRAAVTDEGVDALSRAAGPDDGSGPQVYRAAGPDRFATAVALADRAFPDGADVVHVVSGATFADALGAGAAAARLGGPVLLSTPDALPLATADALVRLGPERVVLVGGTAALGSGVEEQLADVVGSAVTVERVAGDDRFATSVALADHTAATLAVGASGADQPVVDARVTDPPGGGVGALHATGVAAVLVAGASFPDALAAASLAAGLDSPVLLARRTCLPAPVADRVGGAGAAAASAAPVVLVGGPVAVGAGVERLRTCGDEGEPVTAADLGSAWREGCPVGPEDLRRVAVDHRRLDGSSAVGELDVHVDVVGDVVAAFDAAFLGGLAIERVEPVDAFGGDDDASMAANNTSAFNCRPATGGTRWSQHAYGIAVDVNPVQNPYVRGSTVLPPAGADHLDRSDVRPGMVVRGGPLHAELTARGWTWGGDWRSLKDWQHFSRDGG